MDRAANIIAITLEIIFVIFLFINLSDLASNINNNKVIIITPIRPKILIK